MANKLRINYYNRNFASKARPLKSSQGQLRPDLETAAKAWPYVAKRGEV